MVKSKRIETVKVDGATYYKLDGRKRLFTKKEIRRAEIRYDKSRKRKK